MQEPIAELLARTSPNPPTDNSAVLVVFIRMFSISSNHKSPKSGDDDDTFVEEQALMTSPDDFTGLKEVVEEAVKVDVRHHIVLHMPKKKQQNKKRGKKKMKATMGDL